MRAQLTFLNTSRAGETVPLDTPVFTVGRAPSNCLVIVHPAISSQHATIVRGENGYRLDDTSRNGTRVNSIAVKNRDLADGDIVSFCGIDLRFLLQPDTKDGATRIIQRAAAQPTAEHRKSIELSAPVKNTATVLGASPPRGEKVSKTRLVLYAMCGLMLLGMVAYSKISKILSKNEEQAPTVTTTTREATPVMRTAGENLPPDSLAKADECFQVARHLAKDQTHTQNRYRAVLKWQEGLMVLEQYRQRPLSYDSARVTVDSLAKVIDERYQQLRKEQIIVVKQKDFNTATGILQEIMDLIPNQTDSRHQQAVRERAKYRGAMAR
jgi:pSer/pThr/pTyr-binding forkhead associated (FHA) protein